MKAMALLAAAVMAGAVSVPVSAAHLRDDPAGLDLLVKIQAGLHHPHTGEAVHVIWDEHGTQASVAVVHGGAGAMTVHALDRWTVQLGAAGGGLVDHAEGWYVSFPDRVRSRDAWSLDRLGRKYTVSLGQRRAYAGRACTMVELYQRDEHRLQERLCVAEETGLVLRRETYRSGGELARLTAYLSIDDDTRVLRSAARPGRDRAGPVPLAQHRQDLQPLDLDALARRGTVPDELPGGYEAVDGYALTADDGAPLQVVYRDGLYTVSLFQQPGHPDWDALPPGWQRAQGLSWQAYEWPGAMPQRLVWEAGGTTYSLIGDAPRDEFLAIAQALPAPEEPGTGQRLRRGLHRLWGWVTGWTRG